MPFTIRSDYRVSVPSSVTSNASSFLKSPLACLLGFWLLATLLVLSDRPVYAAFSENGEKKHLSAIFRLIPPSVFGAMTT